MWMCWIRAGPSWGSLTIYKPTKAWRVSVGLCCKYLYIHLHLGIYILININMPQLAFLFHRHSSPHLPPNFRISVSSVSVKALSPQAGSDLCVPRESPRAAVWVLDLSWLTELNKAIHKGKKKIRCKQLKAWRLMKHQQSFLRAVLPLGRGTNALRLLLPLAAMTAGTRALSSLSWVAHCPLLQADLFYRKY